MGEYRPGRDDYLPDDLPGELELASVDQLIEELTERTTFRGVVLFQAGDYTGSHQDWWRFVHSRSISNAETARVMEQMAANIRNGDFTAH